MRVAAGAACVAVLVFAAGAPADAVQQRDGRDVASARTAPGEAFDPDFLELLEWRDIGPLRGGRSLAITGHPDRRNEYFFGATGGGLWHTADGGETWTPVTDGQITSSSVGAVAWSESDPDVLYIGMGEVQLRGSITQGDGVYRSRDGGRTWEHVGLEETQAIGRVRIHPEDPDLVYVAALGHPYGPNPERGVFRSRDGGESWERILFVSDSAGAPDLILDPNDPATLYATTWQVYRKAWKMWGGGPHSGLWKSTDGGDTWDELTGNPGMPEPPIGKIGITVSPTDSDRLWAIVEAHDGGVFRSDDAGATWERVNSERKLRQRAFYYSRIYADPADVETVYALNTRLYKSTDGGRTFDELEEQPPHGDQHDLWIAPDDPSRLANANDGGGNISVNGGATWTDQEFNTAQLYHVMATSDFPYHVCGAQQDNSTVCVPSEDWWNMHDPREEMGHWMYAVGGGESGYIAQHPDRPDVFYAGSQGALLTRYDRSAGNIRDIQPDPRFFSGEPAGALRERWQWTFPIVFSPHDSRVMYTTSQHVWRTTDDGQSWERISPDLTYADPATLGPTGGLITMDMNGPEIYATVFALAPSPHDPDVIWAGSDDGLVHITRDGGGTWEDVTPPDMEKYTRVSVVEASPHAPGKAYVAANRYQVDDRAPYVWRTEDYGRSWTKIVDGIDADHFARAVREDSVRPGLLFLGTEHGVYVSFDDGDRWRSLQLNLPDTPVRDLVVRGDDVVLGTHGRGFWILDDIGPLRELTPETAKAPLHLFQPGNAYRLVQAGHWRTRRTDELLVDYWLSEPADDLTLEILDAAGEPVHAFRPAEPDTAEGTGDDRASDEEEAGPRHPTAEAGMNRFVWDLHVPGAATFDGMVIWRAEPGIGPPAPPSRYRVRLTADGRTQEREFEIRIDPRLEEVTEADLREQFRLAAAIRDATDAANRAVMRVREVRESVTERLQTRAKGEAREGGDGSEPSPGDDTSWTTQEEAEDAIAAARAADPELADAARDLLGDLRGAEEALYQTKNRSHQDPLNFAIRLNNRLATLRRSVENGEARPTDGHYRVYRELVDELQGHLEALGGTLEAELPRLNELLRERGLDPVRPVTEPGRIRPLSRTGPTGG